MILQLSKPPLCLAATVLTIVLLNLTAVQSSYYVLNNGAVDQEQLLIDRLLLDYNKKLRPSGTVQVKFALNLNQIIKLIEKDQIFMLNVFIDHEWIDERLAWNPEEFGNLTVIRISSEFLWTPDTFVYTTADHTGFLLPQTGAYFVVSHTGNIFWPNPLTQMRVRCRMSIAWFPFDDQLCVIVFGSWSYTFTYLNYTLINEFPSLENYTENNEWSLVNYKPIREEIKYDNWIEDDLFSEIRYKILIKRKPLFVLQNFVIPALMLCIITLVTFFVPFAQEMQLGISIMLAFSVFKLRLSDDVPVQSDSIPLINIYFTLCMSFSLSAMIWFSLMNIYKENKRLPKLVRAFVLKYLCYVMCSKNFKQIKAQCCSKKAIQTSVSKKLGEEPLKSKPIKASNVICSRPHTFSQNKNQTDIWIRKEKLTKERPIDFSQTLIPEKTFRSIDLGTPLDITMSESYLNFDQVRNRKDISPATSEALNTSVSISAKASNSKLYETKLVGDSSLPKSLKSPIVVSPFSLRNSENFLPDNSSKIELTDLEVLQILNRFVFVLFLLFIIALNLISLFVYPYFIKVPLSIDEEPA